MRILLKEVVEVVSTTAVVGIISTTIIIIKNVSASAAKVKCTTATTAIATITSVSKPHKFSPNMKIFLKHLPNS